MCKAGRHNFLPSFAYNICILLQLGGQDEPHNHESNRAEATNVVFYYCKNLEA